jgi:hypothetical protein
MATQQQMDLVKAEYAKLGLAINLGDLREGAFTIPSLSCDGRTVVVSNPDRPYADAVNHQRKTDIGQGNPTHKVVLVNEMVNPMTVTVTTESAIAGLGRSAEPKDFGPLP